MGGRTRSETNTNQTQTSTTPGTTYGTALLPLGNELAGQVMDQTPFQGDRVSTIAPNYQPGIEAGLTAANQNAGFIPGLVQQGFERWGDVLGGQTNPALNTMLQRLQQEHAEGAAQTQNQAASLFGQQGAYGGTDMDRAFAWIGEQQQQELDSAIANLLWQDYNLSNQMLLQAPGAIAGFAGLGTLPAEQQVYFGGLGQQNLRATDQAALDNAYLNWLTQQETLASQINNLGQVISYGGLVPGSTTNLTGRTSSTSSTTPSPLAVAGGLLGAGLQAFAPGGLFSGSLSALGGVGGNATAPLVSPMPNTSIIPPYTPPPLITPFNPYG